MLVAGPQALHVKQVYRHMCPSGSRSSQYLELPDAHKLCVHLCRDTPPLFVYPDVRSPHPRQLGHGMHAISLLTSKGCMHSWHSSGLHEAESSLLPACSQRTSAPGSGCPARLPPRHSGALSWLPMSTSPLSWPTQGTCRHVSPACVRRRRVKPFALKRANQFVPPDTTTFLFDKEPGETDYKLQVCPAGLSQAPAQQNSMD